MSQWLRAVLLFGAVYLLVGRVSMLPKENVGTWRLAAWIVSAAAFTAHFWYEHFRLRSYYRRAALHIAMAVSIAASGLAVSAMIRSLSSTEWIQPNWMLALALWPAVTAIPAFLISLAAGAVLTLLRARNPSG